MRLSSSPFDTIHELEKQARIQRGIQGDLYLRMRARKYLFVQW